MKKLYSIINKEVFESLPLTQQRDIFKAVYPNLVREIYEEWKSTQEPEEKTIEESTDDFVKDLNAKDKHLTELVEGDAIKKKRVAGDFGSDDFLKELK